MTDILPGAQAWAIGGAFAAFLAVLTLSSDQSTLDGMAAAISNGLVIAFLWGAVQAAGSGHSAWTVALVSGVATFVAVLAVRLLAVALGAGGPFGSVGDTTIDVTARAAIVAVIGALGVVWTPKGT